MPSSSGRVVVEDPEAWRGLAQIETDWDRSGTHPGMSLVRVPPTPAPTPDLAAVKKAIKAGVLVTAPADEWPGGRSAHVVDPATGTRVDGLVVYYDTEPAFSLALTDPAGEAPADEPVEDPAA